MTWAEWYDQLFAAVILSIWGAFFARACVKGGEQDVP